MRKIYNFINMLVVLIAFSCLNSAFANITKLFTGTIGKAAVVMELEFSDNHVSGRYYYQKYKIDNDLDGQQLTDGSLQLAENQESADVSKPDMALQPNGQGWQGIWHGHDPKQQKNIAISLSPAIIPAHLPQYKLGQGIYGLDSVYDRIRIASLTLHPVKLTHFGKYTLQWWEEPITKISSFRVLSGYTKLILEKINKTLANQQFYAINEAIGCLSGMQSGGMGGRGYYEQTITPTFMNNQILSASIETNYYAGSPHPNYQLSSININSKTGEELHLEDLFWLAKEKPEDWIKYRDDGDRVNYDYEDKILAPWLVKTMTELYPSKIDTLCGYRNPSNWNYFDWYFTPKGLYFGTSFAYVETPCVDPDWSIIPWAIVNQHQGKLHLNLP